MIMISELTMSNALKRDYLFENKNISLELTLNAFVLKIKDEIEISGWLVKTDCQATTYPTTSGVN